MSALDQAELVVEASQAMAENSRLFASAIEPMPARHVEKIGGQACSQNRFDTELGKQIGGPDAEGLLAIPLGSFIGAGMHGSVGSGECVYSRSIDALDFSRPGIPILVQ